MESFYRGGITFNVIAGREQPVDTVANGVGAGGSAERQHGCCSRHGVKESASEIGGAMRHDKQVAAPNGVVDSRPRRKRAGKLDLLLQPKTAAQRLQLARL